MLEEALSILASAFPSPRRAPKPRSAKKQAATGGSPLHSSVRAEH